MRSPLYRFAVLVLALAAPAAPWRAAAAEESDPGRAARPASPPDGAFVLSSPAMKNGGPLPVEFTGDGASATPPLTWTGAPPGTQSYALIMHHEAPDRTKWYWLLYDIPPAVRCLPRNVQGVGTRGNNSVNGRVEYAPPHSKGPGPKRYVFTLYALSAPPELPVPPAQVSRDVLLKAMENRILDTAELTATYSREPSAGAPASPPPVVEPLAPSLVAGRPTDRSVTVSVLSASACEGFVEYGRGEGPYAARTGPVRLPAGEPVEILLEPLEPDTRYVYRLQCRRSDETDFAAGPAGSFHTQRAPGSAFTFALQGDSHPERAGQMYDPALYARTMRNVVAGAPDFYVTMGDDFSMEPLIRRGPLTQDDVDRVYASQRAFLGEVGRCSPLFLVNGNHEQAALCNLDGTPGNAAVLAARARTRFFPLPAPDLFYTGDAVDIPFVGPPRDYYAWTWGDALFVVIDFYWHSAMPVDNEAGARGNGKEARKRDLWSVTLGDTQYRWLTKTLMDSQARWKFVFCHHVLGTGRGGIEEAGLGEWGGRDRRGADLFAQKRPGWELPIHQLMAKTGVTIFFQGHDHLFARQELDGVIYQSCPNPADPTYQAFNRGAYRSGDILPNSGHLRVTVSPQEVAVDYVRSCLADDEIDGRKNGETAFHYTIRPKEPAP